MASSSKIWPLNEFEFVSNKTKLIFFTKKHAKLNFSIKVNGIVIHPSQIV